MNLGTWRENAKANYQTVLGTEKRNIPDYMASHKSLYFTESSCLAMKKEKLLERVAQCTIRLASSVPSRLCVIEVIVVILFFKLTNFVLLIVGSCSIYVVGLILVKIFD
jgi:hypothetical protein